MNISEIKEKVLLALDEIRPFLASDGGDISLESIKDEKIVRYKTIKILRVRSKAMQESMPVGTGGMVAILGSSLSQITEILPELNKIGKIYIANDNAEGQIVLSGEISAIDHICSNSKIYGLKRAIKLPVSAPFHCELINSAKSKIRTEIKNYNFKDFEFPLISNVEAMPCSSSEIGELLINQVVSKVRWRESVEYMIKKNVTTFIEIGPGKVLSGLVKRINSDVPVSYTHLTLPTSDLV